jgi:hypothetical protein
MQSTATLAERRDQDVDTARPLRKGAGHQALKVRHVEHKGIVRDAVSAARAVPEERS